MAVSKKLKTATLVIGTFLGFASLIYFLAFKQILTPQQAGLFAAALFGMYVGFGVLILVYRLVNKL